MYSKILVSFLIVILVIAGSRRTNASPVSIQSSSLIYKPSIAELTVPFRENPKILLINFPGKSVVLNLLNGHSSASNYLVHLARQAGNSDAGSFIVEAPKGHGVMAVIQRLHLRRISDTSSLLQLVNNCKDYLLFEGQKGEQTIPICGNLERGDRSFYPSDLHGPKFFNSPNGRIKVTFRNLFDYGNELVTENDTEKHEDSKEILTLEVSFTAYSNCLSPEDLIGKFQCTLGQCIEERLVCDDIENCTPGENQRYFGVDEKNCSRSFAEVDPNHGQGHDEQNPVIDDVIEVPYQNDPDLQHYSNKPLPMTTIIILVIILMFLTVCGYFWSWLSHVCCVLKGIFRSAEVGVEQHSMSSNNDQMYAATPPRLSVAYYVPAVVLRATSTSPNSNNNDNSNHNSSSSKIRTNDSDAPPPAYEMLFPSPKSCMSSP